MNPNNDNENEVKPVCCICNKPMSKHGAADGDGEMEVAGIKKLVHWDCYHSPVNEVKLKECPFCGSDAVKVTDEMSEDCNWTVICNACKSACGFVDTKVFAITLWNTRHSPQVEGTTKTSTGAAELFSPSSSKGEEVPDHKKTHWDLIKMVESLEKEIGEYQKLESENAELKKEMLQYQKDSRKTAMEIHLLNEVARLKEKLERYEKALIEIRDGDNRFGRDRFIAREAISIPDQPIKAPLRTVEEYMKEMREDAEKQFEPLKTEQASAEECLEWLGLTRSWLEKSKDCFRVLECDEDECTTIGEGKTPLEAIRSAMQQDKKV